MSTTEMSGPATATVPRFCRWCGAPLEARLVEHEWFDEFSGEPAPTSAVVYRECTADDSHPRWQMTGDAEWEYGQ